MPISTRYLIGSGLENVLLLFFMMQELFKGGRTDECHHFPPKVYNCVVWDINFHMDMEDNSELAQLDQRISM